MKNQGREGGGLQTRPWVSIRWGRGGGLQTRPWISAKGWLGHSRYHGCLRGGATEETVGLYRGEGGYRRDQGSLPGGSWVTADTMGLHKGEGGGGQNRYYGSSQGGGGL